MILRGCYEIGTVAHKVDGPRFRAAQITSEFTTSRTGEGARPSMIQLELVPQELVVDLVVELDFRSLYDGPEQACAAVG